MREWVALLKQDFLRMMDFIGRTLMPSVVCYVNSEKPISYWIGRRCKQQAHWGGWRWEKEMQVEIGTTIYVRKRGLLRHFSGKVECVTVSPRKNALIWFITDITGYDSIELSSVELISSILLFREKACLTDVTSHSHPFEIQCTVYNSEFDCPSLSANHLSLHQSSRTPCQ